MTIAKQASVRTAAGSRLDWVPDRVWAALAVLAGLVFIIRSGLAIHTYSQTFDEPYHIASAVALYETGAHVMGVQHGPLPRLVAGLPLYFAGVRVPLKSPDHREIRSEIATDSFGADVLFRGPVSYWKVLTLSRWAMLLVFPPLSLLYVFLLGRLVGGPNGISVAALATIFFSLDPALLGHAFWVCTDVAACAGFLAALYHGLRYLGRPTPGTAAGAGVALGLAISCKFSCALVVPGLLIVALPGGGRAIGQLIAPNAARLRMTLGQIALIALAAFFSLWATYLFAVGRLTNQDVFGPEALKYVPQLLTQMPIPMPSFVLGLLFLIHHDQLGHANYLNGHLGFSGHWYYFPEVIALKEPLAVLAAILLAAGLFIRTADDRQQWRRAAAILVPAGVFLAIAMLGNINLGIRHVLPVLPCLYLFTSLILARQPSQNLRLFTWRPMVLLGLILATVAETVPVAPDYLSYFNIAAGGASGGERYLLDSNLDWGQDVARLADYLNSPAAAGRAYTIRPFDLRPKLLAGALGLRPDSASESPHGLFAMSLNVSHGMYGYHVSRDKTVTYGANYDWVKRYPRVRRVGTSIDIYDLDAAPVSR